MNTIWCTAFEAASAAKLAEMVNDWLEFMQVNGPIEVLHATQTESTVDGETVITYVMLCGDAEDREATAHNDDFPF